MKLVVGLIGRMGAGKGVVSDYINEKYGASQHRFSQVLMDLLDRLYLPHDRKLLQELGACIRNKLGMGIIVDAFKKDLERDGSKIIVVDGIRYKNEVEMLRSFENNLLLSIDAPVKLRYERCKNRGEKGESTITYKEFLEAENRETERYIDDIKEMADYVIENTGTLGELFEKTDNILNINSVSL
ncbi:MAG: AAA family ATPase [Candidatus Hydrothermarchaeales archaeon]